MSNVEKKFKSSQECAAKYLQIAYEDYVKYAAECDTMSMEDWVAGSDIPGVVRARTVANGGSCIGRIWWCADSLVEAQRWEAELTAKGAKVELRPEDDRPVVDVIITLDCARANEILGYAVGSDEWLEEDDEQVRMAEALDPDRRRAALQAIAAQVLAEHGWIPVVGVAASQKVFQTAVGDRVATAQLGPFDSERCNCTLQGSYLSEGRNALEPQGVLIPWSASPGEIVKLATKFAQQVDVAVGETYAARLLSNERQRGG